MKLVTSPADSVPRQQSVAPGRRLSICHLGKYFAPAVGGIETHVRTLAHAQADLGADVRVVCVNHRDRRGRTVVWSRFGRTSTVEEHDGKVRLLRLGRLCALSRIEICPALPSLARLLRAVDIVHLHMPNLTMTLALTLLRPKVPLVITYHNDVARRCVLAPVLDSAQRFLSARSRRILSTTATYAKEAKSLQDWAEKVTILPLGIELEPYQRPSPTARAYTRQLRAEHGTPLWLAVGRLVYYKGLHHALAALRHVPGKLLIVGAGPLKSDLLRQATALGVAQRVLWREHLDADQLAGAYQAATALWFPSNLRAEAFGLVQVEAMASGCPVINCAIPGSGVPWVSRHEHSGLTVPINDPAALAQAACRLLDKPELRSRLAAAGRERARREFGHWLMAERSLATYERVLSGACQEAA